MDGEPALMGFSDACRKLEVYCNAVVELDEQGAFMTSGVNLGCFLLRGRGSCPPGRKLAHLMPHEEDKNLFASRLFATPQVAQKGKPESLCVHMRDGNGSLLRLELLWFRCKQSDGRAHFALGVRDAPVAGCRSPLARGAPEKDVDEKKACSAGATTVAGAAVSYLFRSTHPLMLVDARSGVTVRECSWGFLAIMGNLDMGVELADIVDRGLDFSTWLQGTLDAMMHGLPAGGRQLTLRMPDGPVEALCEVVPEPDRPRSGDSLEESYDRAPAPVDLGRVCLLFSRVKCGGCDRPAKAAVEPVQRMIVSL